MQAQGKEKPKRRAGISRARGIVVAVVFLSVVVGLVAHTGTGTVSALGWRDIAAICPVGALEVLAGSRGLALHTVLLLVLSILIAIVFGKAFCSWICPTRYVRRIFGANGKKKGGRTGEDLAQDALRAERQDAPLEPVGGKRDGFHLDSRHFVLLGAIGSSFAFGFPVFCLVCPVGLTFGIVIGLFNLVVHADTSWGLIVFPALLVLELVVFRKWCTHLCPISALLSLVSGLSRNRKLDPKVDRGKCLRGKGADCRVCVEECPEEVDPHSHDIPECSKCGICAEKCPAEAIYFKLSKSLSDVPKATAEK